MPATPTPATRPAGAFRTASASAARAAATSAVPLVWVPSAVVVHGVAARPKATSRPSRLSTTALQDVVPMSNPTSHVGIDALLGWDSLVVELRFAVYRRVSLESCQGSPGY